MTKQETLRAAAETAPRGPRGLSLSPEFKAALAIAREITIRAVSREGLRWVACRRCGGTGVYQMQSGPGPCSGHNREGYCYNGKSLGPADRKVMAVRKGEARVAAYRAAWSRTVVLVPVTRRDHTQLARELDYIQTHGTFAAKALATAHQR